MKPLDITSFLKAAKIPPIVLRLLLLMILVEKWRIKTLTFHFSYSKVIITLEDETQLMDLPIERVVVNGEAKFELDPKMRRLLNHYPEDEKDLKGD